MHCVFCLFGCLCVLEIPENAELILNVVLEKEVIREFFMPREKKYTGHFARQCGVHASVAIVCYDYTSSISSHAQCTSLSTSYVVA